MTITTTTVPKERPADTNSVDTLIPEAPGVYPYPRWWSSIERGSLFSLCAIVLGLVIYCFATPGDVPMGILVTGILGAGLGFLTNGLAVILLILNKYGPKGYWIWNCLWDIIAAACCIGGFAVAIEGNKLPKHALRFTTPEFEATKEALKWFLLITGVCHFAANVAGFYGIHLVNKRGRVPGADEHDDLDV